MSAGGGLSRRSFIGQGLAATSALAVGNLAGRVARALPATASGLPEALTGVTNLDYSLLPGAQRIYDDVSTMVDFGPRLTGSTMHNDFLGWLTDQFRLSGCSVLPYDNFPCNLWEAQDYGLDVLTGPSAGPVRVASYYVRGGETPDGGVVGKMIYAGRAPAIRFSGDATDVVDLKAMLDAYQREFGDWITASVAGLGAEADGAILLIDVPLPPPINEGVIGEVIFTTEYMQWPGGAWQHRQYKRMWIATLGAVGADTGNAAGAVYVLDASYEATKWQYLPFGSDYVGFPALWVDRDTGAGLRSLAQASPPDVRFTMTARKTATTSPSIVAILPGDGSTDEVMIGNTHTDGTNFVEENGTIVLLELARYFRARQLQGRGLRRSLVFSLVTGHWNGDPGFPQTEGFIEAHPDLIARAVAAITPEHFGCTEWYDDSRGFYSTGVPEAFLIPAAESGITFPVLDSVMSHNLLHHGVSRGVFYLGIGAAFEAAGVPGVAALAGPNYLTTTGFETQFDGCLPQMDANLFARQVAWMADLYQRLDGLPAAQLAAGDTALLRPGWPGGPL